jgi:hypothetical protein
MTSALPPGSYFPYVSATLEDVLTTDIGTTSFAVA